MALKSVRSRTSAGSPSTVAIGFVSGILSGVSRAGLVPGALLEHAEIATELLHDRTARVPVARYAALYRLINESLDDEGFALFSRPLHRGSFEFLCRAVLSAANLNEALERIARFLTWSSTTSMSSWKPAVAQPSSSSAKTRRCRSVRRDAYSPSNGCCA